MEWKKLLSAKRPRQTTLPKDLREQFERDYGRAIFSTPVKRLQDKAQVFPLEPHDAVRTRLTHSLEVSSVARDLATAVARRLISEEKIDPGMDRQIEAIAAVCGLIHDIGNPPFGHSGESSIQQWFRKSIGEETLRKSFNGDEQMVQDFLGFEGNAQTLRLVAKLQILADDHGLNLTYGTLSALGKYIAPSHRTSKANAATKKPGYFASENGLIEDTRRETGTGEARNPITYLVEAADDIVYSVADIEDGVKKGVFTWEGLHSELASSAERLNAHEVLSEVLRSKDVILSAGKTEVPIGLPDDVHASAFRTAAIGLMVPDAVQTFFVNYDGIMRGEFVSDLVSSGRTSGFIQSCKDVASARIYTTPQTLKLELMGHKIILDLLDWFWEGAKTLPLDGSRHKGFGGKFGVLLSQSYKRVFESAVKKEGSPPEDYLRFQLLTDYVCGMTDTFARTLHKELGNG